jgi:hypothetical protein
VVEGVADSTAIARLVLTTARTVLMGITMAALTATALAVLLPMDPTITMPVAVTMATTRVPNTLTSGLAVRPALSPLRQ